MWTVCTTNRFDAWLFEQNDNTQEKVLAALTVLGNGGPSIGRPLVDTIKGSKFKNMKELRIQHQGDPIRAFFAFDPNRQAIILCAGNKVGNEKMFYKQMVPIADAEYQTFLATEIKN